VKSEVRTAQTQAKANLINQEGATRSPCPAVWSGEGEDEVRSETTWITIRPKQEGSINLIEHIGCLPRNKQYKSR